jgi:lipopolysaccharide/colanic/teichoic acid biosynthesis glycosyltransferase
MFINYWLKSPALVAAEINPSYQPHYMNGQTTETETGLSDTKQRDSELLKKREEVLFVEINKEVYNFIFQYANIASENTLFLNTTSRFNISSQINRRIESIVNLKRINDIRYLNKFFEAANHKLTYGGVLVDAVETKNLRKARILRKFPPPLNYGYYFLDFVLKRIFPKFAVTKKIYFTLTRGHNRVLTKAETFGRLYSCGFEIVAEKEIDKLLYFVARKVKEPQYPKNPTYGPMIKLPRIGKNGRLIKVYKLRTMHPFAEYLQEYVYHRGGLKAGGKFNGDFRVSTLGRFLRCMWIDELPMFINFFKGEMKIVGVRPLSEHYFGLYSKELQEKRINHKPGLIPPFYADRPVSLEEIQESEMRYLNAYEKHPLRTDIKYFFVSVFNIIFHRFRSS